MCAKPTMPTYDSYVFGEGEEEYMLTRLYTPSERPNVSQRRFLERIVGPNHGRLLYVNIQRHIDTEGTRMRALARSGLVNYETIRMDATDGEIERLAQALFQECDAEDDEAVLRAVLQLVEPQVLLKGFIDPAPTAANALVGKGSRAQTWAVSRLVVRATATALMVATPFVVQSQLDNLRATGLSAETRLRFWELLALNACGMLAGLARTAATPRPEGGGAAADEAPPLTPSILLSQGMDVVMTLCIVLSEWRRTVAESDSARHTLLKDYFVSALECDIADERHDALRFINYMLYVVLDNLLRVVRRTGARFPTLSCA